jgi:5-methylcytosine-specific restriction endonuclease McrA
LLPGVAARLIVLGPLLRPLIQMHWASDIAKWSKIELEDEELRRHLFGSERVAFPSELRDGLATLQDHRCFYCGSPLPKRVEIDHFLAWSRFPNDAIENLVAADRCNGAKSNHLAAAPHVEHWSDRIIDLAAPLRSLATETQWSTNAARSRALVKSTYGVLAVGTPLWSHDREFAAETGPVFVPG